MDDEGMEDVRRESKRAKKRSREAVVGTGRKGGREEMGMP